MSKTVKYLVRAVIAEGVTAPHPSRLESALDAGIQGASEDSGLDSIENFEVIDVTNAGEAAAFDQELLDLARRKLVEFRGGRVTLTQEGYLAVTRLFGRP